MYSVLRSIVVYICLLYIDLFSLYVTILTNVKPNNKLLLWQPGSTGQYSSYSSGGMLVKIKRAISKDVVEDFYLGHGQFFISF